MRQKRFHNTESITCTRPNAVSILDALKFASVEFVKNFTLFSCLTILTNSPPRVRIWKKGIIYMILVSWGSEATPSAIPFFKRAYKISHPPQLWVSWIDLPSFASSSKIWPNFSNKVFFSWSYEKVILTKNVRLTYYSSMKKKSERFGWFLT